jgi:hypothetical protein
VVVGDVVVLEEVPCLLVQLSSATDAANAAVATTEVWAA